MEKVIKDGKVAILYSPGYGVGWSTYNDAKYRETLCMDADIVNAVLEGNTTLAMDIAKQKCPGVLLLGGEDLTVHWLYEGTSFIVAEYDGNEKVQTIPDLNWMLA